MRIGCHRLFSQSSDIFLVVSLSFSTDMQVSCMGVDEWLMMCKKVKSLLDKFPADWQNPDSDGDSTGGACYRIVMFVTLVA